MTRSTEHQRNQSASDARDDRLLNVEQTVRRALVVRNGIEAGCEAAAEAMAWAIQHRDQLDSLSTGDVVRVTPGPQGWFLAVAVIPIAGPGESIEVVSTEPTIIQGPIPAVPVADAAPLAVGESVMLGAAEQLQAGGFVINADEIFGLPGRYPNVSVLDWDGLVESRQVPGLAGDGIHLGTPAAQQFYANYVFAIVGRDDLTRPLPE